MRQIMDNPFNKEKTDRAWKQLYGRLEQDQLLEQQTDTARRFNWGFAAAIVVLCLLCAISLWIYTGANQSRQDWISLQNDDQSAALVTTLTDGSVVYLSDQTTLSFPAAFDAKIREVELQGNAQFDVTGNPDCPFVIDTKSMQIEVLGTAFRVQSEGRELPLVSVMRGSVKVTAKANGKSIILKAGESVELDRDQFLISKESAPEASYPNRIRFKDESLIDILTAIQKQTDDLTIEVSPELYNRQLTVTFSNDTPETMIELISHALNLQYKKENNRITLFE